MRRPINKFVISSALVSNALLIALFAGLLQLQPPVPPPALADVRLKAAPAVQLPEVKQGQPVRLQVDQLAINLPVQTGSYNQATRQWSLDTSHAFYADLSVPSNNSNGTTLIYAHAQAGLFDHLTSIKPGAVATVTTANGYRFIYDYQSIRAVSPKDVSILGKVEGAPELILQTCSGPGDSFRSLASFSLRAVETVS